MRNRFRMLRTPPVLALGVMGFWLLTGCSSVYNATMEHVFGYEKRELLKKSVAALQEEQKDAQAEFTDALTQLKALYGFDGGELESFYGKVKTSHERCERQAREVQSRIEKMEKIARSMFAEWESELQEYRNANLAAASRAQLQQTRERYTQLSQTVRAAEAAMQPVLGQLKDNVLFLKHNLNASAIGALQGEAAGIQQQIEELLRQMNASITESDRFIQSLPK